MGKEPSLIEKIEDTIGVIFLALIAIIVFILLALPEISIVEVVVFAVNWLIWDVILEHFWSTILIIIGIISLIAWIFFIINGCSLKEAIAALVGIPILIFLLIVFIFPGYITKSVTAPIVGFSAMSSAINRGAKTGKIITKSIISKKRVASAIKTSSDRVRKLEIHKTDFSSKQYPYRAQTWREKVIHDTGWSRAIVNNIRTQREAELYTRINLVEGIVNGKTGLMNPTVIWNRNNISRIRQGLSPLDKNGNVFELHHIGQHNRSPLAELTREQHRGALTDKVLHNKRKQTEIDRAKFNLIRKYYWQHRPIQNVI